MRYLQRQVQILGILDYELLYCLVELDPDLVKIWTTVSTKNINCSTENIN